MTDRPPSQFQHLRKGIRRVLANNPSPMTHWGTNTFLVGTGNVAVIDPGPNDPVHLRAIQAALAPGERISHIFVTHAHLDHSPLAASLSLATGAPIYAHGGPTSGRSEIMQALARSGLAGGGEGVDTSFMPDIELADGQTITGDDWQLTAHWTPGHFGNHMCFAWRETVFTGDHIMAWASSLVSPPDGDLTDFMASLDKLAALNADLHLPAHGPQISEPDQRINWLIKHRRNRRSEILAHLTEGPVDAATLTRKIYLETPPALLPAAERNVFAHLIDLVQSQHARPVGDLASGAKFILI